MSPPLRRAVEYSVTLLWQLVILQLQKESHILQKKSVEAGRYYTSEAMRDPKLQKKAINYTLEKARPVIQKVGSEMLDQLSTKVRPNQRYKTDRPDLDGAGFDIHAAIGKFRNQKRVGHYQGIIIPGHIIPLNSR